MANISRCVILIVSPMQHQLDNILQNYKHAKQLHAGNLILLHCEVHTRHSFASPCSSELIVCAWVRQRCSKLDFLPTFSIYFILLQLIYECMDMHFSILTYTVIIVCPSRAQDRLQLTITKQMAAVHFTRMHSHH